MKRRKLSRLMISTALNILGTFLLIGSIGYYTIILFFPLLFFLLFHFGASTYVAKHKRTTNKTIFIQGCLFLLVILIRNEASDSCSYIVALAYLHELGWVSIRNMCVEFRLDFYYSVFLWLGLFVTDAIFLMRAMNDRS